MTEIQNNTSSSINIPNKRYFTIGEASKICDVKAHVLRYWESEFKDLEPIKVILVSRLLYDKGILDYLELVETSMNINYEFYLAGERDHGNPQNITDEDMDRILGNENLKFLGKLDVIEFQDLPPSLVTTRYGLKSPYLW
mgnify:CR=1 FL=1